MTISIPDRGWVCKRSKPVSEYYKHLELLIAVLISRIQVREIQVAQYGSLNADPHIVNDKKEAERQLTEARSKLRLLHSGAHQILRPYVGLATFQEDDAPFFFGREKLVAELVQKVQQTSFLAVVGASGSGKSSVVRAGLVPTLKNGIFLVANTGDTSQ
jgi:ABC-type glutathione transport system ATPase component